MFRVEIYEIDPQPATGPHEKMADTKRFEQVVDTLDMRKVIDAVNYRPRGPRTKKVDGNKA